MKIVEILSDCAKIKKDGGGCHSSKDVDKLVSKIALLKQPIQSLEDTCEWIAVNEEKLLGIALTCHKVDSANLSRVDAKCLELMKGMRGQRTIGVEIKEIKVHIIKKEGANFGKSMSFVKVSDGTAAMDVTIFPDLWCERQEILVEGNTVLINGEMDKRGSFVAKKVWQI